MKNYKVIFEFEFTLDGADIPEDIARHVETRLNSYSDGRHQFSSELIRHGIQHLMMAAIEDAVEERLRKKYGNTMVSTKTGKPVKNIRRTDACTSLAGRLTSKIVQKTSIWLSGQAFCPKIVEIVSD